MMAADLIRLIARKSPRLIWTNITERVLFDLTNGVDTIRQTPKSGFPETLNNLQHGLHYSSSWTGEIRFGFETVRARLGAEFERYTFIDLGCGKGKVQIVWEKLLRRHRLRQPVLGLDYYDSLLAVAEANHRKALGRDGRFICADASAFDYATLGTRLIVYLYNPFDAVVLQGVVDALGDSDVLVIYNNPVHADVLLASGYQVLKDKPGFHPQAHTTVFERRPLEG